MSDHRAIATGLAVAWALALAVPALAQEAPAAASAPPPDKSGFTLFDPTPSADLRALCTDRPTKSASPCTVDAGHFQIESDLVGPREPPCTEPGPCATAGRYPAW